MSKTIKYTDYLKESLRDTNESTEYLNAALETHLRMTILGKYEF